MPTYVVRIRRPAYPATDRDKGIIDSYENIAAATKEEAVARVRLHVQSASEVEAYQVQPMPPLIVSVGQACDHLWDGPRLEAERYTSATCSRCGRTAIDVMLMEGR